MKPISQKNLLKNNELLEKIFSTTHMLMAYMDTKFNILRVNKAYARTDGRDPEYYVGKNHQVLFPNEENHRIFRRVMKTGKTYTVYAKPFEYVLNPEREVTYWDWTAQAVKDEKGKVIGLLLCLIDVTERQKMQEKLLESYKHLGVINRQLSILMSLNGRKQKKDFQEIVGFIIESSLKITKAKTIILYKFNKKENTLTPIFSSDPNIKKKIVNIEKFPLIKPLIESSIRVQGNFQKRILQKLNLENNLNFYIFLPIRINEELKGAFLFAFSDKLSISIQELEFLETFSLQASYAMKDLDIFLE
ncbi:MAG: PAS domain S-box [Candidatus Peregrinibacteria bacterium GW2011_GWA2_33_10]|nr:MAG: PAS domain S-box [Candidatus Peregrinibacteria bacterium GW2011_GWA2_33_10]KKP38981.1 MAG: sensor histidine kinase [Candidatus Peregrinibacteria bacterium GW2011_GWC2_33_13]